MVYLSSNYMITLNSAKTYKLHDKLTKEERFLRSVSNSVMELYGLTPEEFHDIWMKWMEGEVTRFNNYIADLTEAIYKKTGVEVNLRNPKWSDALTMHVDEAVKVITEDEKFSLFRTEKSINKHKNNGGVIDDPNYS